MSLLRSFTEFLKFIDYHNVATQSLVFKQRSCGNMVENQRKVKTKPHRGDTLMYVLSIPCCKWIEFFFTGH